LLACGPLGCEQGVCPNMSLTAGPATCLAAVTASRPARRCTRAGVSSESDSPPHGLRGPRARVRPARRRPGAPFHQRREACGVPWRARARLGGCFRVVARTAGVTGVQSRAGVACCSASRSGGRGTLGRHTSLPRTRRLTPRASPPPACVCVPPSVPSHQRARPAAAHRRAARQGQVRRRRSRRQSPAAGLCAGAEVRLVHAVAGACPGTEG
jgi:hypothetical protein